VTPEEWRRIKAIVFEASALEPAVRPSFIAQACGGDDSLLWEVSSLLESMEGGAGRFDNPPIETNEPGPALQSFVDGADLDEERDLIGQRIGPYEIQRELGRGGMGTVYLASRADREFTHAVALKIIKRGMDTSAIVRRFRTERQILADLEHPNIARLLDGGTTADGLPYLVMEYVDGRPLTTYCDERGLSIGERLGMFRKICEAVAFAHQHLVVHRDIKPSNVLVSRDGEPKLLDFGLAKILDAQTSETETVHRWMTPMFASPEQLRGDRITTVSDVYSLGLLLYELLCGVRPFGHVESTSVELLRAVLEEEPEKPSIAAARHASDAIGRSRQVGPERLRRTLRGDLDNIVLKALQKDPARRYATAQDLSEDIRRHLARLPVSARRDTFLYHAAKFVRRHTAAVAAAAIIAVTLVAATVVTLAQARIAQREREHAQRRFKDVRQLANAFLFDFHDKIATLPGATPAREMVVKTAQEYLSSLAQEAGTDRELLSELSTAYFKLGNVQGRPSASRTGDTDGALASYSEALALRRRLAALDPSNPSAQHDVASVLVRMGPVFQVRGDPGKAIELTREAMQITDGLLARTPGPSGADIRRTAFRAPLYLGDALFDAGDYDDALAMFQKALRIAETAHDDPPESDFRHRMAVARERLGIMLTVKGDSDGALASFRRALENEEAMSAAEPDNADYVALKANGHYYVGDALKSLGRYPQALEEEHRALALYEALANADPRNAGPKKDIGGCAHKIAEIMIAAGDHTGARRMLDRAVAARRELADHDRGSVEYLDDLADSLTLWGESLTATLDPRRAIEKLDEARALREPMVASRGQQGVYRRGLARLYTGLGDAYSAEAGRSRGTHAVESWRAARERYKQALDLWLDLSRRGALWAEDASRPEEASRRLAICERALHTD
jgi:serine/threonine protein kinase/Flp pilus assembly protein TadD